VHVNWLGFRGKELVVKDVSLALWVVGEFSHVRVFEGQEGLDLLSIVGLGKAPDVLIFDSVVQAVVGPGAFCLAQGVPKVSIGLALFLMGGGEVSCHVGKVALVIPPHKAAGVWVALPIEGGQAGGIHVGVKGMEEALEGVLCHGYKGATSDRVKDPVGIYLCLRGWVMGRSRFCPHLCVNSSQFGHVEVGGEVLELESLDPGIAAFLVSLVTHQVIEQCECDPVRGKVVNKEGCMVRP